MSQISLTYKARDVEEWFDRLFYRPIGYWCARLAQIWALSPNAVTIISIVLGVVAGHLFVYPVLAVNLVGIALLVSAEILDSADGQLARMTGSRSRFGRILDGIGGNLIFISVYLHLCLRVVLHGGPWWVFPLAILAGASHSFQCALADYYRNAYLYFVYGEERSELDSASLVAGIYTMIQWSTNPLKKFVLRVYLNYTRQQEWCSRSFLRLRKAVQQTYNGNPIPSVVRSEYAALNKPLLKYYNIITTNTRMAALFCAVIMDVPIAYLVFEVLVLNGVWLIVRYHQEQANRQLFDVITYQATHAEEQV